MPFIKRLFSYLSGRSHFNLRSTVAQRLIVTVLGCCHVLLLCIFFVYNIYIMVVVNIFSIATYLISYIIAKKEHGIALFRIIFCEIMIHLIMASICVGPGCGFELYCMAMVPISYYRRYSLSQHESHYNESVNNPFIHSIISVVVYICLLAHSQFYNPIYTLGTLSLRNKIYAINFIIVMAALIAFMSTFVAQAFMLESKLKAQNLLLEKLSHTDSLTGLYNRRSINECFNTCITDNIEFSVIMSDIDDFKIINDNHGHEFGDNVLELVAKIFTENTRANDTVCRWGGEEILVLLPDCPLIAARRAAEDIRNKINETSITNRGQTINFTMTFGLAHSSEADGPENVIHLADKRLYSGKDHGKNCIISNDLSFK